MKKEAVSVLKPRNGKNFKNKVGKSPEKTVKVENVVAVSEPRESKKPKIVDNELVKNRIILGKRKIVDSNTVNHPDSKNIVKSNAKPGKIGDHVVAKMAVASKNLDETRAPPKKKLKKHPKESIAAAKKRKNIVKPKSIQTSAPKIKATKKRKSKVMVPKSIENVGDLKLTKMRVLKSIEAIQKLSIKQEDTKKSLLPTDNNPLLLQVTCVKIAKTPRRNIRPYLPHPLVGPLDDVALFVPDLVRGRGRDYEQTVDHWETILREKGVDCIKEVIPMNRVKTEFRQYEMQRKLAMSFDYFLVDGRIAGHMTYLLGKAFFKRRTAPTPVKLSRDKLKEEFNFALHKTCMEVHSHGNSHTMPVGTISMDSKKLAENVWAACEGIKKEYPGGWDNIRSLRLKSSSGLALPIFMSLASKNDIPVPVVKPKRPRAYETVSGELTTVPGGANVELTPEGRIYVKRLKDYGDKEQAHDDDDDDDEDEEEEEVNVKRESESEKEKSDEEDEEAEDEDDDDQQ